MELYAIVYKLKWKYANFFVLFFEIEFSVLNKIDMIPSVVECNILMEVEAGELTKYYVLMRLLFFYCKGSSTGSHVWTLGSPAGSAIWEVMESIES